MLFKKERIGNNNSESKMKGWKYNGFTWRIY